MKVVLQRVSRAAVSVGEENIGAIGPGYLLLVGIHGADTKEEIEWMSRKISRLRLFEDENGKMNRSIDQVNGGLLIISQFTLYGDARKGNRPSFIEAAPPEIAEPLYDYMVNWFKTNTTLQTESGRFGAMMNVELVNDGPVTLVLDRSK